MTTHLVTDVRRAPTVFELEALESLPCGCVAADYRARSMSVGVISLEAKGPHCTLVDHTAGEILGLGDTGDLPSEVEPPGCRR